MNEDYLCDKTGSLIRYTATGRIWERCVIPRSTAIPKVPRATTTQILSFCDSATLLLALLATGNRLRSVRPVTRNIGPNCPRNSSAGGRRRGNNCKPTGRAPDDKPNLVKIESPTTKQYTALFLQGKP